MSSTRKTALILTKLFAIRQKLLEKTVQTAKTFSFPKQKGIIKFAFTLKAFTILL